MNNVKNQLLIFCICVTLASLAKGTEITTHTTISFGYRPAFWVNDLNETYNKMGQGLYLGYNKNSHVWQIAYENFSVTKTNPVSVWVLSEPIPKITYIKSLLDAITLEVVTPHLIKSYQLFNKKIDFFIPITAAITYLWHREEGEPFNTYRTKLLFDIGLGGQLLVPLNGRWLLQIGARQLLSRSQIEIGVSFRL